MIQYKGLYNDFILNELIIFYSVQGSKLYDICQAFMVVYISAYYMQNLFILCTYLQESHNTVSWTYNIVIFRMIMHCGIVAVNVTMNWTKS